MVAKNGERIMVRHIQFITDERLMVPGTGLTAIKGQLLGVGSGELGANFPYRNRSDQIAMYGEQHYVLVASFDKDGNMVEDTEYEPEKEIDAANVLTAPQGVHEVLRDLGADGVDEATREAAEQASEKPKRSRLGKRKNAKASSGKKKIKRKKFKKSKD